MDAAPCFATDIDNYNIYTNYIKNALQIIEDASSYDYRLIEADKLYKYISTTALHFVRNYPKFMREAIKKAYEIKYHIREENNNDFTSFDDFLRAVGEPLTINIPHERCINCITDEDVDPNGKKLTLIEFNLIIYECNEEKKNADIIFDNEEFGMYWDANKVIISYHASDYSLQCNDATIHNILTSFFQSINIDSHGNDEYLDTLASNCPLCKFTVYADPDYETIFDILY